MPHLTFVNQKGQMMNLEGKALDTFQERFAYLYDEYKAVNIFQVADQRFMETLKDFPIEQLSDEDKEDFPEFFQLHESFSMEYNLNIIAMSVRVRHTPALLACMKAKGVTAREAMKQTNQEHLWAI